MHYQCHVDRLYYVIIDWKTGRHYEAHSGKIRWKYRDAKWIVLNHELPSGWRVLHCRTGAKVVEYRQSKKGYDPHAWKKKHRAYCGERFAKPLMGG